MGKQATHRQQKALITGASGFLGQYVVHELRAAGYDVVETSKSLGYDLRNESEALTVVWLAEPDVIVHCARIPLPQDAHAAAYRDTMLMGLNVLQAAAVSRAKVVFVSPPGIYAEEDDEAPGGEAGSKKALISALAGYRRQYGLDCRSIAFSELYGPFARPQEGFLDVLTLVNTFLRAKISGAPGVVLPGDGSRERQPLCVNDAAKAVLLACNSHPFEETLSFAGTDTMSEKDLVVSVAKACAYEGTVEWNESIQTQVELTSSFPVLEVEEPSIGWVPQTSLDAGLAAVVALRIQEMLPPQARMQAPVQTQASAPVEVKAS